MLYFPRACASLRCSTRASRSFLLGVCEEDKEVGRDGKNTDFFHLQLLHKAGFCTPTCFGHLLYPSPGSYNFIKTLAAYRLSVNGVCVCVCIYTYIYICTHTHSLYVCVYMYVCMYIHIYIYIYILPIALWPWGRLQSRSRRLE